MWRIAAVIGVCLGLAGCAGGSPYEQNQVAEGKTHIGEYRWIKFDKDICIDPGQSYNEKDCIKAKLGDRIQLLNVVYVNSRVGVLYIVSFDNGFKAGLYDFAYGDTYTESQARIVLQEHKNNADRKARGPAQLGMTEDEVVQNTKWGSPTEAKTITTAKGVFDVWTYKRDDTAGWLTFHNGRLTRVDQDR
jgi:hypothetical protein